MSISIDKKSLEKELNRIEKKFDRAGYEFDRTMTNGLSLIGDGLVQRIRKKAPVDTGALRKSIQYKVNPRGNEKTVTVYSDSKYFDVMDEGFGYDKIFPKKAKKDATLRIPKSKVKRFKRLTKADRKSLKKHGAIFRKFVTTPEVKPNSKKGPNMFFSGQINRIMEAGEKGIKELTDDAFKRSFSGRGYEGL